MDYKVIEKDRLRYMEYAAAGMPLNSEKDAVDLISGCFENKIHYIVLHAQALSDDFFKLRTGVAGMILQKFINYRVKVAVVLENDEKVKGKFKELLSESNKGSDFRTFFSTAEAERWFDSFIQK